MALRLRRGASFAIAASLVLVAVEAAADAEMLEQIPAGDTRGARRATPLAHQVHLRAIALFESQGLRLPAAQSEDLEELSISGV